MRENYLSWDEYFMGIALLSAMRSKDPQTQVGACIVNEDFHTDVQMLNSHGNVKVSF